MNKLPTRFGFLLVKDFTLISMSSAIEPMRMANRISKKAVYGWRVISETGNDVSCSAGVSINVDYGIDDPDVLTDLDAIIVCGGRRTEDQASDAVSRWLVNADRRGVLLGAICTGSYLLAKAGLLDDHSCSIHWENIASLADSFPRVRVTRSVYTIDRNRMTSSGGTAPVDMMLHLVRQHCGAIVSAGVAEQFVYDHVREIGDRQRVPLRHSIGNQSEKLIIAIELMEANVKEPISQSELAHYIGLSRRQLQRLFQRYLTCTPSRHYLEVRLLRAREFLRQTNMSLVEISAQTGFGSSSHFSKSYKEFYQYSPSEERRKRGEQEQ